MYDFNKHLYVDEKILYQGRSNIKKISKNISGHIFVILFMGFIQFLLIWSVQTKTGDGANGVNLTFIMIFLVTLLFDGICIYGIIYTLFLKEKQISDDHYCITNKRALKYEENKDKLTFGYLINYKELRIDNKKNNHGDIYMGIILDETDAEEAISNLKNMMLHPNPQNMPTLIFESLENPDKILEIIKNAKKEILETEIINKCPNCDKQLEYETKTCSNCNINLSFTTALETENNFSEIKTKVNKVNKTLKICIIISILFGMFIIPFFPFFLTNFGFNDVLIIYNNIIKIMLCLGILILIISLILYFVKYKNKLIKTLMIISIILISLSLILQNVIKIDEGFVLKDYINAQYIEIGSEKIPSLYSVVGKRNIITTLKEDDSFDSDIGIELDSILIIYEEITEEDIDKYKHELLNYGFKLETIINEDFNGEIYIKNNYKDDKFYIVSIDGFSIIYSTSGGQYEDVFEEFLIQ